MRSPELLHILPNIPKDQSILLIGPPGIGKTEVIEQFAIQEAKNEGRIFINFHEVKNRIDVILDIINYPDRYYIYVDLVVTTLNPEDLLGYPKVHNVNGFTFFTYEPPIWARLLSLDNISGLLFIDELTNVNRPDVIAAAYKVVLERKVGFVKLNNNVRIIAAGNAPEHSSIAKLLPTPLINRLIKIDVEPPTIDEWINYMRNRFGDNWDKRVVAYLNTFPEDFIELPNEVETLDNFATPRSWTKVALLNLDSSRYTLELLIGILGKRIGTKFYAFITKPIPEVIELLNNPEIFNKFDNEQKAMICWSISQFLEKNIHEIISSKEILLKLKNLFNYLKDVSMEYIVLILKMLRKDIKRFLLNIPELELIDLVKDIIEEIYT